jgi:hypothetical protein
VGSHLASQTDNVDNHQYAIDLHSRVSCAWIESGGIDMRDFQIAVLAAALILGGCGTPVTHATGSGKVEVGINGATPEIVKPGLVNKMVNYGYRITKDTPYEIAFDRPTDNLAASILLGSKYDAQPNARVSYFITATPPTVRVVADIAIITNPGSSFERRTEMNNSQDSVQVQALLDDLKMSLETPPPPVVATKPPKSKKG